MNDVSDVHWHSVRKFHMTLVGAAIETGQLVGYNKKNFRYL